MHLVLVNNNIPSVFHKWDLVCGDASNVCNLMISFDFHYFHFWILKLDKDID